MPLDRDALAKAVDAGAHTRIILDAVAAERERCAKIAEAMEANSDSAYHPYDGGSGSLGYEKACREIAEAIRKG